MSNPTISKGFTWASGATVMPTRLNQEVDDATLQFTKTNVLAGRSTAGAGVAEEIDCTATGRAVLAAADQAAGRAALGVGLGTGDLVAANNLSDVANPATARGNLGLGSVNNTADTAKPVSTAQQAALDLKAPLNSPPLTGVPTAPTAAGATNNTQIATTAFVQALIAALIASAPGALDTLDELAAAFGDDPSFAATVTTALATKMAKSANLSDLTNVGTARTNLGLGSAAQSAASAFDAAGAAAAAIAGLGTASAQNYLTGTWTPNIGGSATYSLQEGTYTKIGRLVFVGGHLTISTVGSGSVSDIGGLPFAASGNAMATIGYFSGSVSAYSFLTGIVSGSAITLRAQGAASSGMVVANFFNDTSDIWFSAVYET